jgi:hypothetical protein
MRYGLCRGPYCHDRAGRGANAMGAEYHTDGDGIPCSGERQQGALVEQAPVPPRAAEV